MFSRLKILLTQMIAGANITSSLFFLLVCWSVYLVPSDFPRLSLLGLSFPFFLLVNILFFFFWLIFNIRYSLISLVTLLLGLPFIMDYCPVNRRVSPPDDALKVLSYNVAFYGGSEQVEKGEENEIVQYILHSDADIICLQEASGPLRKVLDNLMRKAGYHVPDVMQNHKELLEHAYFRMPVLSVEEIKYDSESNGSIAYHLLHEDDTLLVINNHLESNRLNRTDKDVYKKMIFDPKKETMANGTRLLIRKMAHASAIRAPQVDIINKYIKRDRNTGVILCGDFNDSPVSYTCNQFGRQLKSAFVESGCGLGISYNKDLFYVRIDHIFHSDNLKSFATMVDNSINLSDHYPIITYIKDTK